MDALFMWLGMSAILYLALPFIVRGLIWCAKNWIAAWDPILYGRKSEDKEGNHGTEESLGSSEPD